MRSDDRAISDKNTADIRPKNDISANDLLKLLHESVKRSPAADEKKQAERPPAARDSAKPPSAKPLEIDEDVYNSAKRAFYSDENRASSDDSELDIDALIEKYIKHPEEKPVSEPIPAVNIVKKIEPAETLPDADLRDDDTFDDEGIDDECIDDENIDDESCDDDGDVKLFSGETEATVPVTVNLPARAEKSVYDKTALKNTALNSSGFASENLFDGKTSVFDIKKVREAAGDPNEEFGQLVDKALDSAATEVFDAVRPEEPLPDAEKTYGQPDADEIDQTDLNLMIAFGMNDELKEKVGEAKASEIEADIEKKHEETAQLQAIGKKFAYTSRTQNTEILTAYKSQYYTLIVRIFAAVLLLGATFLLENYTMFGLTLPSFMNPDSYPVVYAMIDLQFVVLCGALVYRQIIDGVKNLFLLKPTPESLTSFAVIFSAIYTCASCFIAPRQGFRLYNLPVTAAVALALIYEFMNLKRNVFSFNVISSKKKKFVVTPVSDATESLEREIFKEYVPSDSQIIRVGRTDFVDGFFDRVGDNKVSKPVIGITIPVVLILAAAFFILEYMKSQNFYDAMTLAFLTAAVTMPLTSFIIYSYPFYKAAKDAYDSDSTIIGEVSFNDYAGSSVISFEDKEVFPSSGTKVTSIKVYANNRIDEVIYNLASAFITVGGPLADVFSQATHDLGHSENVVLEDVSDDGFTVTIDDILVSIGKASYMEKQDYDPPYDAEDKRIESGTSVGILYIAYQGQLAAKVYVQYTIDAEFEKILAQLYKTGMCVGIKSFDPNIDDLLLAKKIKAMKYPVKVIRSKTVEDIPHAYDRCDSGIVSKRSVKELLRTVALCERVRGVIKTNLIVKILAMLIGVVVMVFVYSFGSELAVSSLYITLYQLFWLIPVLIISRLSL